MVESLPHVSVALNGLATVLLVSGWVAIRRGRDRLHMRCMVAAVSVAATFLVSFIAHKVSRVEARELPVGLADWNLLFLLLMVSHFLLAVTLIPLVLGTLFFAWRELWERHRRFARIAVGVWLYVSLTGMVIYAALY